jgi:hypothetical protein
MLPIPGAGGLAHLEENVSTATITLTDNEFEALDCARRIRSLATRTISRLKHVGRIASPATDAALRSVRSADGQAPSS